jgi:hypothetical protein
MTTREITVADLAREPFDVASALPAWARGDRDEAIRATLEGAARGTHSRGYTLWIWTGRTRTGEPAWALPVLTASVRRFAPKGPAGVLIRCMAAAVDAAADPDELRLLDWGGIACMVVPGIDNELAVLALAEHHPEPARIRVASMPDGVTLGGPRIPLEPTRRKITGGLVGLAWELDAHPASVALELAAHGQPITHERFPPELADRLREWGLRGSPPEDDAEPSLAIDDDPCPRRRHARKVVQRLLRMGKVGAGYHTAFDHMYRGAPADQRREALEVSEALLRAGILGEKPSVGQRHVYLRREALPEIHALVDRGATDAPALLAIWTTPVPGTLKQGD